MSRFYDIQVGGSHWTSHPNGVGGTRDPGALNVEMNITVTASDQPAGQSVIRVWGAGLQLIQQASQFAWAQITVQGGMGSGLPLSNSSQAGLIVQGRVFRVLGNYEGVNQSIDFQISGGGYAQQTTQTPGPNPAPKALNGTFNWLKGQPLAPALQQTLKQMFPNSQITMRIQNIIAPQDLVGYHSNLYQLATMIRRNTQKILGNGAPGVSIVPLGTSVIVDDASQSSNTVQINYQDLIGMPTFIDINKIEVKCPMRADIKPADKITLPQGVLATGQLTNTTFGDQNELNGTFYVTEVRYVGNFRQPDASSSWCTIIQASSTTGARQVAQ